MYQSIEYTRQNNTIHIWDDKKGYMRIPYQQYAYIKDPNGEHVNLFGQRCSKSTVWSREDVKNKNVFESDVDPVLRILTDLYLDSDDVSVGHKLVTFDIEVAKGEDGYCTPMEATNEITSIAMFDHQAKQYHVFILDRKEKLKAKTVGNVSIYPCWDERELLSLFLTEYNKIEPTILTGWNIDYFDIPYLYNRLKNVLGKKNAGKLSPIGIVYKRFPDDEDITHKIVGVSCMDYLRLYREFNYSEEESYTLDAIATKVLKRGKIEYDGDLDHLFETDIEKFIEYNLVDVELVVELDNKLDFIELARGICHKGHVPYEDVYYSSRYLDGASLVYLKKLGIVAPNKKRKNKLEISSHQRKGAERLYVRDKIPNTIPGSGQLRVQKTKSSIYRVKYSGFKDNYFILSEELPHDASPEMKLGIDLPGAFVKDPQKGRHEWIYDLDLTSLYPSIIMTLGISPETKLGKVLNFDNHEFIQDTENTYKFKVGSKIETYGKKELKDLISQSGFTIAANGVMYDKNKGGFIPSILDTWFNERVEFKDLMKKYKGEGDKSKAAYYHKRQLVQKIMLNSFYGVLALGSFRFYDIDNAEAVTSTGQQIIKFSADISNLYYNRALETTDKDYNIYIDTDSLFYSSLPIIKHRYPDGNYNDQTFMTNETIKVATEVQKFVNDGYNLYAKKFHNADEHRLEIKQELVGLAGFWVTKKRYAQLIINEEGVMLPEPELDVKGLDVVRSNFPKHLRTFMGGVLTDILVGKDKAYIDSLVTNLKDEMKNVEIQNIMFPSGVKNVKKYDVGRSKFQVLSKTPIHVKSSLYYNDLLKHFKDRDTQPINNGDKVKYTYLKKNPLRLETLALKGFDDNEQIVAYVEEHIDRDQIFESALGKKLGDFYDAMGWDAVNDNKYSQEFFEF